MSLPRSPDELTEARLVTADGIQEILLDCTDWGKEKTCACSASAVVGVRLAVGERLAVAVSVCEGVAVAVSVGLAVRVGVTV